MKILTTIEIQVEVELDYRPSRPVPMCQNHDDPRFSDSGDFEELEVTGMTLITEDGEIKLSDKVIKLIDGQHHITFEDQAREDFENSLSWDRAEQSYYNQMEV